MTTTDHANPSIGQPIPKPWGVSIPLFLDDKLQVDKILANPGGFTSQHLHEHKWNDFWLVSGVLIVRCFHRPNAGERLILRYETRMDETRRKLFVPPGMIHQFEAVDQVEAYEFYGVESGKVLDRNDIVRFNEDGTRQIKTS